MLGYFSDSVFCLKAGKDIWQMMKTTAENCLFQYFENLSNLDFIFDLFF